MSGGWKRWRRPILDINLIAVLLATLSSLPPDTSLAERRKQGVLRYCVPDSKDMLFEAERQLAKGIARQLGLKLQPQTVDNMGRSFNPRDWNLNRSQCDIIGGIADTATNRNFLMLLPNGGRIALVRAGPATPPPRGAEMGVFLDVAGLDRIRLATYLRKQGWRTRPLHSQDALEAWLTEGKQAVLSTQTRLPAGVQTHSLPPDASEVTELAFGLWRGDVTLIRAVRHALEQVHRNSDV